MNIELDPIASYHHHLPDSWSSKAHQASWESLVSGCVPPLTDPHRKRGRSSRIGHPIPSVYVVLSPLLRGHPFLSWSEHESGLLCTLRAIRHTHTRELKERRIHNSRQFDPALTNVLLPSWFQQPLTRPPKQWMPWCCDSEPRWQRSTILPEPLSWKEEGGHR